MIDNYYVSGGARNEERGEATIRRTLLVQPISCSASNFKRGRKTQVRNADKRKERGSQRIRWTDHIWDPIRDGVGVVTIRTDHRAFFNVDLCIFMFMVMVMIIKDGQDGQISERIGRTSSKT